MKKKLAQQIKAMRKELKEIRDEQLQILLGQGIILCSLREIRKSENLAEQSEAEDCQNHHHSTISVR